MLLFLTLFATYIEYIQRHFINRQKAMAQSIFLLINNYFLINIGRFRLTNMTTNKRLLDYALEICLVCVYICLEIVMKSNESYPKKLYNVRALRKIQANKVKITQDFIKLSKSTLLSLLITSAMLMYFFFVARSFKISLIHLSLPVI